jgi:hypothetical protein
MEPMFMPSTIAIAKVFFFLCVLGARTRLLTWNIADLIIFGTFHFAIS